MTGMAERPDETPDDQAWFWTEEWQAGEREADAAKAACNTTTYHSAQEFLDAMSEWEDQH